MPFKSKAQRRKFAQLLVEGKISNETFEEWNHGGAVEVPLILHHEGDESVLLRILDAYHDGSNPVVRITALVERVIVRPHDHTFARLHEMAVVEEPSVNPG